MASSIKPPTLHTKPYPPISAEHLENALGDHVVVVTGASGVLGKSEALAFARAGAKLALVDLSPGALSAVVNECKALGATTNGYICNVINEGQSTSTLRQIEQELGLMDVLVNNAGGTIDRPFHMEAFDQFWAMVDLNFKAVATALDAQFDALFSSKTTGIVTNIASRSATVNTPFSANYGAAKAALVEASGCIQLELDMDGFEDIDIYSLHPGATMTNLQKRLPPDVAAQYPKVAKNYLKFTSSFVCEPSHCGQTCAYLATGKAKALRGRYFDCEQDLGYVSQMGDIIKEDHLYELKVEFLGGLPNDDGSVPDSTIAEN